MSGKAGCGPGAADFFTRKAGSSRQSGYHGQEVESGRNKNYIYCLACYHILYNVLFLKGFLKDRGHRPRTAPPARVRNGLWNTRISDSKLVFR